MTSIAPWWGVPVIAGSFLLLGGLLGFFSNLFLESRKQSRAEAIRWDSDIRELAAEIISLGRRIGTIARVEYAFVAGGVAALRVNFEGMSEEDRTATLNGTDFDTYVRREVMAVSYQNDEQKARGSQRFELFQEIQKLTASLDLVAPREVRAAAKAVRDLSRHSPELTADSPAQLAAMTAGLETAVEELIVAVRSHLGRHS